MYVVHHLCCTIFKLSLISAVPFLCLHTSSPTVRVRDHVRGRASLGTPSRAHPVLGGNLHRPPEDPALPAPALHRQVPARLCSALLCDAMRCDAMGCDGVLPRVSQGLNGMAGGRIVLAVCAATLPPSSFARVQLLIDTFFCSLFFIWLRARRGALVGPIDAMNTCDGQPINNNFQYKSNLDSLL